MSCCHPSRHLCATLLLLVCGCTSLEWHYIGSAEHNLDLDQAQCTAQARLEARRRMPLQSIPAPQVIVDQQGRAIIVQNTQTDSEQFFLEQSLLRQCMTGLGYTLQPKPQPNK